MDKESKGKNRVKSIKRKVRAGFAVLAFILFFSSIVDLYEFTRMNRVLTHQIEENVNSVNVARDLIMLTEEYNLAVLNAISDPDVQEGYAEGAHPSVDPEKLHAAYNANFVKEFGETMEDMRKSFTSRTTFSEKNYADSVLLAYTAYMQVLREGPDLYDEDFKTRHDWYFNRLQPFYVKLRDYIQGLTNASQQALIKNSQNVDATFYRSITPAIASVVVGLLIVLLFNYFINFYLINPLIKISKGIGGYRSYRKNYNVDIANKGDELEQLNDNVRDLIEDHKSAVQR